MKKFRIEKEHQRMKISQYLREVQNYSGRSLRNVEVFLNGKQVRLTKKLPSHGNLRVVEKKKGTDIKPIKLPLDIIFEDEDILVVNKEPFLLTHPTQKKADFTLANGIVNHFLEKYGEVRVPRFYNRLDMNTSGLIIIAKNSFAQAFLQNFSIFEKKYLAIVNGIIDDKEIARINEELAKDGEKHKIHDLEKGNLKPEIEKVNFGEMKKYDEMEKIENNLTFENKDNKIEENTDFNSKKENNNIVGLFFYNYGISQSVDYEYYVNGNLKLKTPHKNDKTEGKGENYYSNGKLKAVRNYGNNIIQSDIEYRENGTTLRSFKMTEGLNGVSTVYYENGKDIKSIAEVTQDYSQKGRINNILNGKLKVYSKQGQLQGVFNFKNNSIAGLPQELYYPNGKIKYYAIAKDNNQKNPTFTQKAISYYDNGQEKENCDEVDSGMWMCKKYDKNGKFKGEVQKGGQPIETSNFWANFFMGVLNILLQ